MAVRDAQLLLLLVLLLLVVVLLVVLLLVVLVLVLFCRPEGRGSEVLPS